jgi:hypothetical protein
MLTSSGCPDAGTVVDAGGDLLPDARRPADARGPADARLDAMAPLICYAYASTCSTPYTPVTCATQPDTIPCGTGCCPGASAGAVCSSATLCCGSGDVCADGQSYCAGAWSCVVPPIYGQDACCPNGKTCTEGIQPYDGGPCPIP